MAESTEELEPLFDYSRVQPSDVVFLDDDFSDSSPAIPPKRKKTRPSPVKKKDEAGDTVQIVDCEEKDELDWLPPPPKVPIDIQKQGEDSIIKELRLKKQELVAFAKSAEDMLRAVEDSVRRDINTSSEPGSPLESVVKKPSKAAAERAKIVISFQDKDDMKQFRVYTDDKFERLFKIYADKVKCNVCELIFCFDGDKISPISTPSDLGMDDEDIVEVNHKSR